MSEYIAKFNEFVMRCSVGEPEMVTISRFRSGLRLDLAIELSLRKVTSLEHAYQVARDFERFQRRPNFCQPEPTEITNPDPESESSQANPDQTNPSTPMTCEENKVRAPEIPPTLYINEVEKEEPEPTGKCDDVEVYEADVSLIDEYEEEEIESSDLIDIESYEDTISTNTVKTLDLPLNSIPINIKYPG